MYQDEQFKDNGDMDVLLEIETVIEELELATQKSISMTKLDVRFEEAFAEPFSLMDKLGNLFTSISDTTIKAVALGKLRDALNEFDSKFSQI